MTASPNHLVNNINKTNFSSQAAAPTVKAWPWLQVLYSKHNYKLVGRSQAVLSKHLLNLRDKTDMSSVLITKPTANHLAVLNNAKLNLLTPVVRQSILPPDLLITNEIIRQLSILMPLEIVWFLLRPVAEFLVRIFLRVAGFFIPLLYEMACDIKYYFQLVNHTLAWPVKFIFRSRPKLFSPPAVVYVPKTIYPRRRHTLTFVTLTLILLLPFKLFDIWQAIKVRQASATTLALSGVGNIIEAADKISAGEAGEVVKKFLLASDKFEQAAQTLNLVPPSLMGVAAKLPGKQRQLFAVLELLKSSREVSLAAAEVAKAWAALPKVSADPTNPADPDLLTPDSLNSLRLSVDIIKPKLTQALNHLDSINQHNLPPQLADLVPLLHDQIYRLRQTLTGFFDSSVILTELVSSPDFKRYLILFQNSSELRPTGGFMGSLAFVDIRNGQVESTHIPGGGPYDFQGQLVRNYKPPEPLRLVKGRWELQDANWSPDFPTSARAVQWFIEQSGGPVTQGVIAVTPDIVWELLRLVGPINLPQYAKVITADNFMREAQLAVELEYDPKLNRPKQFIADLAPLLMEKVLAYATNHKLELAQLLEQALSRRSLQIFLNNPEQQLQISGLGWSGELRTSPQDYLAVIRTNIRGGKTDLVISEDRQYLVKLQDDGSLLATLTVQLKHNGEKGDLFTGVTNTSYLRVYAPRGSTLISTSGFDKSVTKDYKPLSTNLITAEIDNGEVSLATHESGTQVSEESNKTVFGNWLSLPVGESRTITLTYRLPFILDNGLYNKDLKRYRLYVQRQAGTKPIGFTAVLDYGQNMKLRSQAGSVPPLVLGSQNMVTIQSDLSHDEYYGVILKNKDN